MGETLTPARLTVYAEELVDLSQAQLQHAFWRARRELRFFPKIAELRELAGLGSPKEQSDAEALRAWETAIEFADKWIQADPFGKYEIDGGVRGQPPVLASRILSSVRRCRGWRAFKCRTPEDEPFLRKDFLEAYRIADIAENVPLERLLIAASAPVKRLNGETQKPMDPLPALQSKAKTVPEPMTPQQVQERRELLCKQAEELKAKTVAQ
jgi:hypothetical protein